MTSIYNDAERGKAAYSTILNDLNASSLSSVKNETEQNTGTDQSKNMELATTVKPENRSIDDLEDDLDFLLSLKEPVQDIVVGIIPPMSLSASHSSGKILDLKKYFDILFYNSFVFAIFLKIMNYILCFYFQEDNYKCIICN